MELRAAYELAVSLIDQHGLTGWRVDFDTAKRRAGVCRYEKRVIGLSAPLTRLHDEMEVRDTVLHEIAHALVGASQGHNETWRQTAVSIGCSGTRCVPEDAPRVEGDWLGVCPAGHAMDRHRRPDRVLLCRRCTPLPERQRVFEWTYRGRPAVMHPNYEQELDALLAGRVTHRLAVGTRIRLTAEGRYHGMLGHITAVGRTRYTVELSTGERLKVVFSRVERATAPEASAPVDAARDSISDEQAVQPVSLSLLTTDGRVTAQFPSGDLLPARVARSGDRGHGGTR